jgi:hypothetical protein
MAAATLGLLPFQATVLQGGFELFASLVSLPNAGWQAVVEQNLASINLPF